MANSSEAIKIAVIGGSGLYRMEGLKDVKEVQVETPFGKPSAPVITGKISGVPVAFLPRHGSKHTLLPTEIPQRANIYALKSLGVETVVSVSAVGSLVEKYAPGHFLFPDQLVDNTKSREYTFFGGGIVAHASFAEPFCPQLSQLLYERAKALNITAHPGGTYVCMEGPLFSTKAESRYHRNMGYSVIGMTASPEAKLAREAQMCYAPICMVTDYDVWRDGEEVSSTQVIETLGRNIEYVKQLIVDAVPKIGAADCSCRHSLKNSIFTARADIPAATYEKLKLIVGDNV
jgi:5'-methylthioadenosine phosphorylase